MNKAKAIREIDKAMKLIRWNNDIEVSQRVDILNSLYTIKCELSKGTELVLCRKHYDEYKKGIKVN